MPTTLHRSRVRVGLAGLAVGVTGVVAAPALAGASSSSPVNTDAPPSPAQVQSRPPDSPATVSVAPSQGAANGAATSGLGSCPAGWACAWAGANFTSAIGKWQGNNSDWSVFAQPACSSSGTNGPNWKDCASSFANESSSAAVTVFRGVSGQGGGVIFFPGNAQPKLADNLADNDVASNYWG